MPRPRKLLHGRLHKSKAFEIPGLKGRHPLTIYLPPGYDADTHKRYSVAYMFDGQNLFGDAGSFAGGWHLHEALDKLAAKGKQVPIVVGIHHGGPSRAEELAPWKMGKHHQPRGSLFLDWVVGRLAEMVAEDLRILQGPEHTMVGGSSLGGLMALYAHFKHPEHFGKALAMSPSLWVGRGQIFHFVQQKHTPETRRVYLDAGGREGAMFQHARQMVELLQLKGYHPEEHLLWRPDSKGIHSERHWRRRAPKALAFLYDE